MQHEIHARLAPLRTRHQNRESLQAAGKGLLLGAAGALGLALAACAARAAGADWRLWLVILPSAAAAVAVAGLAVGLCAARRRGLSWEAAAALVDAHYRLEDQTLAALGFADKASRAPLQPLEAAHLAKALADLDQLDLGALVPIGFPRRLAAAVGLLGLAVAISAWSVCAGRPQERSSDAVEAVAPAVQTPEPKDWPGDNAKVASPTGGHGPSRDEVQWRPAGSGRPAEGRAAPWDGGPWEQIAADAEEKGGGGAGAALPAEDTAPSAAGGAALPPEPVSPAHQYLIRRYVGSLHQ